VWCLLTPSFRAAARGRPRESSPLRARMTRPLRPPRSWGRKKKAGEPEEARCQLPDALEALERSREPRRRGSASVLEGCVPLPEVIPFSGMFSGMFSGCPGTVLQRIRSKDRTPPSVGRMIGWPPVRVCASRAVGGRRDEGAGHRTQPAASRLLRRLLLALAACCSLVVARWGSGAAWGRTAGRGAG
jgi:hypothetical protein